MILRTADDAPEGPWRPWRNTFGKPSPPQRHASAIRPAGADPQNGNGQEALKRATAAAYRGSAPAASGPVIPQQARRQEQPAAAVATTLEDAETTVPKTAGLPASATNYRWTERPDGEQRLLCRQGQQGQFVWTRCAYRPVPLLASEEAQ